MADPAPVLVKDLLSLPEHIRKGDFVVKLAEGIDDPKSLCLFGVAFCDSERLADCWRLPRKDTKVLGKV